MKEVDKFKSLITAVYQSIWEHPETGAVHACGHAVQIAGLVGVAIRGGPGLPASAR